MPAVASGGGFAFGPFTLDVSSERLLREGTPLRLTPSQVRVLHALVSRAGEIIDKDTLVTRAGQYRMVCSPFADYAGCTAARCH